MAVTFDVITRQQIDQRGFLFYIEREYISRTSNSILSVDGNFINIEMNLGSTYSLSIYRLLLSPCYPVTSPT